MSSKSNDFKLGLFVVVAVAILLAALFIFGASKLFEGKTVEETYVAEGVEGLKVGAPVLLRGVPVGEVTSIGFSWNLYHVPEPRYVVVDFTVDKKVSLVPPGRGYDERVQQEVAKGLRARVKSQGLAGATILSLEYVNPKEYPPLPVPWKSRYVYIPAAPGQMSEILKSVHLITREIKEINFQAIGAQVQKDLLSLDNLLKHFNTADIAGVSSNANALVSDLRGVSAGLQAFIGQTNELAKANLQKISADVDHAVLEAGQTVTQLSSTATRLDRMLAGLDETSLNQAIENIRRASDDLQETIRHLRQYPSGVLFGKPPAPAKSVEHPGNK
jgi:ABC-type transporter Mla subunit MlaD